MPIDLKATTSIPAGVREALGLPLSVSLYGATGDGSTDDTTAIAAAMTAAAANGGAVYFPPGTYIASAVPVPSNVTLVGPGSIGTFGLSTYWGTRTAVIKQKASTTGPLISDVAAGTRSYGVTIRGLTIDGNKSAQSASNHGIELYDAADPGEDPSWIIEDCLIRNCKGDGIHVGAWRRNNRIDRSEILHNDGDGVDLESTDNHVTGCAIGQNTGVGIQVTLGPTHIVGCDIWGNDVNIDVASTSVGTMITNCGIDRAEKEGLNIAGPLTIVTGCSFVSNSQSGDGDYAHISLDFPNLTAVNCVISSVTFAHDDTLTNKPSYGVLTNLVAMLSGLAYNPPSPPFTISVVNAPQHAYMTYDSWALGDGTNLHLGTSTGSKIGTATSQKIGFWNKTPIVQPTVSGTQASGAALASLLTALDDAGLVDDTSTAGDVDPFGWGLVLTGDPKIGGAIGAWSGANRGMYVRVQSGGTISKIGFEVGTSSGNISVAAYANSGTGRSAVPATRLATSGAVACPASGYQEVSLGGSITVEAGDWLFLSCDNTTATFNRWANVSGSALNAGIVCRQDSAHPAPSPAGTLAATSYVPILVGVP